MVLLLMLFSSALGSSNINSAVSHGDVPARQPLLPIMTQQSSWLGVGDGSYKNTADAIVLLTNRLHFGWVRDTFGSRPHVTNDNTFAWSKVQYAGSNSFNWATADQQVNYLTNTWPSGTKVVLEFLQGDYSTNNCPNPPCDLWGDPPWASGLTTQQYAAAKAHFINAVAARYTNTAWGAGNLKSNVFWGIEVENEPQPPYDRYLLILSNAQPARTNCKLVGWTIWGPLAHYWTASVSGTTMTALVDAISWHLYTHETFPPDVAVSDYHEGDPSYVGRLDQWENWLQAQLPPGMPILADEIGMLPQVPMRMAKVLILLRAAGAAECSLFNWQFGTPPGQLVAFEHVNGGAMPYLHARIAAWTAYWLGNCTNISSVVNSNAFIYSFSDGSTTNTFAWAREGTTRGFSYSNYTAVTDIYGYPRITPSNLTANVLVFHGAGGIAVH
jgi:hypothetical protein